MLRKFLFVLLVLLSPLVVRGQLLSVTATLTDSDSTVWANGTCTVQLYSPNGTATYLGTVIPAGPQACTVNGSGVLSTSIYNTSTITPTGAQYRFSIASATSAPASSFLTPVTAANMTTALSALLVAPRFNAAIAFAYGYADVEAIATQPGAQYYKTTSTSGLRIYSGSAWTSGGSGGSGCTASGAAGVVQASNGSGACQATNIIQNGSGDIGIGAGANFTLTGNITQTDHNAFPISSLDATLATSTAMGFIVGNAAGTNNSGYFRFSYVGSGSAQNFMSLGLFGADDLLQAAANGTVKIKTTFTVATLPSAATVGDGSIAIVTDASTFTVGTCTGGGSNRMLAMSNGTTWSCH